MLDATAAFDAVVAEFYEGWFRYHPDRALELGLPVSGRMLPPQEDDDLAALRGWIETLILSLDEIAFTRLDADRQLDFELLAGAARIEHQESLTRDWRRLDPLHFLPVAAIDRLTLDPTRALDGALPLLLEQIPEHLRQAQAQLREMAAALSAPLVRVAAAEAASGCCSLRHLARGTWLRERAQAPQELQLLAESAADALAGFSHLLTTELAARARGEPGCGSAHLQLRLRYLHGIDCDPATLDESIAGMLRATEDALDHLADAPAGDRNQDAVSGCAAPVAASARLQQFRELLADAARARRLPRRLANAVSLTGGWHLYVTDRPGRTTVHAGDQHRWTLIARRDCLRRAALDLHLHTGRIDSDQALARLRQLGLTVTAAEAAFARIVLAPGDALAAVLGWRLLDAARAHEEARDGTGFAERAFHDRLVSQGPIPLALALRYGLSEPLWQSAAAMVFGP